MKYWYVCIVFLMAFALPCFAATITVTMNDMAPAYVNTKVNSSMVKINLSADGPVSMTGLVLGLNYTNNESTAYCNEAVYRVLLFQDIDSNGLINSADTLLGFNATNSTNMTQIIMSSAVPVNATLNASLILQIEVNASAALNKMISIIIFSGSDFIANDTVSASAFNSSQSQIQDLHANAAISPIYIDTNIINQTIYYNVSPSGRNAIQNITITLPSQVHLLNDTLNVERSGALITPTTDYTNITTLNSIKIILATPRTETHRIIFKVNSTAAIGPLTVNSTLDGSNLSSVAADASGNSTYFTVKNLINIRAVNASKNAAYLNGTDYWEFIFDVNTTADVSGLLQFKMLNFSCPDGSSIPLYNSTYYFATLRNGTDFSSNSTYKYNVSSEYNLISGIPGNISSSTSSTLFYLRMIIPSTQYTIPVSANWWTTYSMIFRTTP